MKRTILTATAATALLAGGAFAGEHAEPVKIGVMVGFTGPIESLAPAIAQSMEQALAEASESGLFLGGTTLEPVRGDTGCTDSQLAQSNAERLLGEGVKAFLGPDCSGVTAAVTQNVAVPSGVVVISPSATSPAFSTWEDDGLFFRTAPSDAREGEVMATVLQERGIESIALTYTNNDYGKGLADAIQRSFEDIGGEVTIVASHEDGKGDYSAEVGALAAAGGDLLVVAGYLDQGGLGIIRSALDTGAWETFGMPGGMIGDSITEALGDDLNGSFGQIASSTGEGAEVFAGVADGYDPTAPFAAEGYDAGAIMVLAMQAAGSSDSADFKDHVMDVANAPGEVIMAGEIAKGLEILANGGEVNYQGATGIELIGAGEPSGSYREVEVIDGAYETIGFR